MDNNHELPSLIRLAVQRYEGEMCEDQFHGEGLLYFEGGHVYKGMFSKGLMQGHGIFTCASGLKYEGEFISNQPLGEGTYTWPDGSFYKGEVFYGLRQGTGAYTCAKTGVSYTGQWDQGKRHGKGEVYYNQDKTSWYKGDWVKNNREGRGVRHYPSGNMYSGEWKNNLRHGEGTMKWIKEGEEYVGMWKNGVQHGQGTLTWILRRKDGSQYIRSNQYTGDFVQGQRHGRGTFHYASGAFYEGEWRNNKKHGKGKFSHKNGLVFEGQFMDDKMMADILNGDTIPSPFCGLSPLPGIDSSVLGPDMVLNINCLLDKFPERDRDTEREKVELMVLKLASELRSIYSYYSRLGQAQSPDNTFQLSRLQLWRLLRDCYIHHHGINLAQIDHLIRVCLLDTTAAEVHSPFTPILLHGFISCLVVVAYHIYHKDMISQRNLLAACFSKLMTDNVLPNAKNVKGFLFRQSDCAVVVVNYVKKCVEIYQTYCKVFGASGDTQSMTCRHLLWMFKDLKLLDSNLTVAKLLQIITSESTECAGPDSFASCLNVEITFPEFLEVLLGSAEVKCRHVSGGVEKSGSQSLLSPDMDRKDQQEAAEKLTEKMSPSVNAQELERHQDAMGEEHKKTQSTGDHENDEGKGVQTKEVEAKVCEQKLWLQTVHQFFDTFFFPAYEHDQLVSKNMKEKLKQESQK